jgi:hypothetical protein
LLQIGRQNRPLSIRSLCRPSLTRP